MQNLKKLIQLISQRGKKNIAVFEQHAIKPGKEQSLFQGLIQATFQNDHSAANYLYQASPEDTRYIILKSRLETKLLNHLLFLDLTESSQKKDKSLKSRCEALVYQARLLIRHKEYQISEKTVRKALRTAKEYEFTEVQLEAQELLLHIFFMEEAFAAYHSLQEEYNRQRSVLSAEQDASLLFRQAQIRLLQDRTSDDTLQYINEVTQQLQQLWKEYQSFTLFDLYYKLHVRQLELEESYPQLLVLTTMADEFVRDLKVNSKRFDYLHNHTLRVYASLRAGEPENGLQLARTGISFFNPLSEEWVFYCENYYLLAIHSQAYQVAADVYKLVDQSKVFTKTSAFVKEKWYLFKAFLDLMHPDEKQSAVIEQDTLRHKLPYSRKDKQGYNVALLIIEFCFLLHSNQRNMLTRKAETYKKYIERHFTSPNLIRERIFFLLMLHVIRNNFQYELIEHKSSKLAGQLKQSLLPKGACVSRIEIVPYTHLWVKIKEMMQKKEY